MNLGYREALADVKRLKEELAKAEARIKEMEAFMAVVAPNVSMEEPVAGEWD